jgi:hypothetical protein
MQRVLPVCAAILSMHSRLHAVCGPSSSERSNQEGGLCQLCPPYSIGARFPHPSQIASAAIVSLQPAPLEEGGDVLRMRHERRVKRPELYFAFTVRERPRHRAEMDHQPFVPAVAFVAP